MTDTEKRFSYEGLIIIFWIGVLTGAGLFAVLGRYAMTHGACK
jgi:hypothetical protein